MNHRRSHQQKTKQITLLPLPSDQNLNDFNKLDNETKEKNKEKTALDEGKENGDHKIQQKLNNHLPEEEGEHHLVHRENEVYDLPHPHEQLPAQTQVL